MHLLELQQAFHSNITQWEETIQRGDQPGSPSAYMGSPNPRLALILEEYQRVKRRYSEAGDNSLNRPPSPRRSYSDLTGSYNARQRNQFLELAETLKEEENQEEQKQERMQKEIILSNIRQVDLKMQ